MGHSDGSGGETEAEFLVRSRFAVHIVTMGTSTKADDPARQKSYSLREESTRTTDPSHIQMQILLALNALM
uniref:Uncharacterized protein n=1 Tax=Pristionchus pacificus TaxID=54126 RepID=A0A454XR55_PRIPA|eukprot:PDM78411.1 hypothetical protein PRIPAC_30990 [Pristionchus pacificus]